MREFLGRKLVDPNSRDSGFEIRIWNGHGAMLFSTAAKLSPEWQIRIANCGRYSNRDRRFDRSRGSRAKKSE